MSENPTLYNRLTKAVETWAVHTKEEMSRYPQEMVTYPVGHATLSKLFGWDPSNQLSNKEEE
jgi:hypothetical protein